MAKISKPVLYSVIASAAIAAYFFIGNDDSTAKKPAARIATTHTAATAKNGDPLITPADLTARFPSYKGPRHDAFLPGVVSRTGLIPQVQSGGGVGGTGRGVWTLTGITTIGGSANALIENTATGATQMLRTGDRWADLRVLTIGEDSVTLLNDKGQRTELTFPPLDDRKKASASPGPEAGASPGAQTLIQPNITIQQPGGGGSAGEQGGNNGGAPVIVFPGGNQGTFNPGGGPPGGGPPGGGPPGGGFPGGN